MKFPPWAGRAALVLLGVLLAFFAVDWALLRWRQAHGSGLGTVQVRRFMSTPLKANRTEFDYVDTVDQPCVRSSFPHQSLPPCWWVALHRDQWQAL